MYIIYILVYTMYNTGSVTVRFEMICDANILLCFICICVLVSTMYNTGSVTVRFGGATTVNDK